MTNVYTDAFCIACPPSSAPLGEIEDYINFIIELEDIADAWWLRRYLQNDIFTILSRTNGYPSWELLREAINSIGQIYHPSDVIRILDKVLEKSEFIEDKFEISEVLTQNISCQPEFYLARENPIYVEAYERLIVLVSLYYTLNKVNNQGFLLVRDLNTETEIIQMLAEVAACEFKNTSTTLETPYYVNHSLTACQNIYGIYNKVDATEVWKQASSISEYREALLINIYQQKKASCSDAKFGDTRHWGFGKEFFNSIQNLGFSSQNSRIKLLLRACSEAILNENLAGTHPLRNGSGGNNPQRIRARDKAKAWRRDIDYDYHLHYWETQQGIEFASVVIHNDMSIPE